MRPIALICCAALLLFATSATAKETDYQVARSCSIARWSLPHAAQQFLDPATDSEASSSGLVSGGYSGVKPDGGGGVCSGRVYKVVKPGLKLWRVASKDKLPDALGSWWSFDESDHAFASRAKWRAANAVCRGWNPSADYLFACTVKKGAFILVGGTQSADCAKAGAGSVEKYPQSPTTQVDLNARQAIDLKLCSKPSRIKRWTDKGK